MPRMKCLVQSDEPGEYDGSRGHVKYQQLALLDESEPACARMISMVDYRLTPEEKALYAGKLIEHRIIIDAVDFEIFSGRLKIKKGKIVEVLPGNGAAAKK